jgi:ankyrin repeat protein
VQFLDAVRNGQIAIAEALVQQGQPVNSRDDKGDTALMVAVTYRQAGMAAKLLALGADRHLVNRDGFTALDIARRLDLPYMVQLLQAPQ